MVDILTIYTGFTHFCREISLVAITHFGRHFLAKFSGRRRKSILLDRVCIDVAVAQATQTLQQLQQHPAALYSGMGAKYMPQYYPYHPD